MRASGSALKGFYVTAQQAILCLGTITLTGCGAGLVLIHDSNPLLKGLNWMGAALVAGGVGAGTMLGVGHFPALEPASNLFVLLAFLCCYRADHYLLSSSEGKNTFGMALFGVGAVVAVTQWLHLIGTRESLTVISLLICLQLETTARLIQRSTMARRRLADSSTVGLMRCLGVANILRGACAAAGLLTASPFADSLNLVTYTVFIAVGIALGFAFFWRTTAKLSFELEHMASTDPLTRVYNRRVFLQWCESEQRRSARMDVPFSLLMVDFDHFKKINDTFGHHIGDEVLCAAVERIQDSIRGIDVLCRWGGEEFAVLLPNATADATMLVAERVRRNVLTVNATHARFAGETFTELQLSASIGTATFHGQNDNFQTMLKRADSALYEAKRGGRNRVVASASSPELEKNSQESMVPGQLVLEGR